MLVIRLNYVAKMVLKYELLKTLKLCVREMHKKRKKTVISQIEISNATSQQCKISNNKKQFLTFPSYNTNTYTNIPYLLPPSLLRSYRRRNFYILTNSLFGCLSLADALTKKTTNNKWNGSHKQTTQIHA